MLAAIHGTREDLAAILSAIPGGSAVTKAIDAITAEVRSEAEKGAKNAIPEIRREVRAEVLPYVVASLAASGTAVLLGLAAIVRVRRSGRGVAGAGLSGRRRTRERRKTK